MRKNLSGQSITEYLIITSVVLFLLVSTGTIERIQQAFQAYFDSAVERMK